MKITNFILMLCMYPFVFIMYFILKNEAVPKRGLYYGVTLSKEYAKDAGVEEITRTYNRQMKLYFWMLMLAPIPMLFIPWFSIYLTFWMVWLVASIFVFFIPFARANTKLKQLKREKGWQEQKTDRLVEIKSAGRVRKVKFYRFAAPCILSVGTFVWALVKFHGQRLEALSITIGSMAFITLLFYAIAVWMDKQPVQVVSMDSEVNVNYARAKKNLWKNFWVAGAWVNTAYTFCMLFMLDKNLRLSRLFIWSTVAYILAICIMAFFMVKKKKNLDTAYQDKMDVVKEDDDDNWLWGILYYNPRDKHSMVEKRVGIGTTTNMATPAGKGLAAFCGLTLLSLPVVCIWCILLEFVPIRLSVTDGRLIAGQLREDYTVPVSIIEDATLLTELPDWSKVNGTGMENLQKGTFRIPEEGRCEVFLNPENHLFIRFEAAGTTYYMGGYDDRETQEIYETILKGNL